MERFYRTTQNSKPVAASPIEGGQQSMTRFRDLAIGDTFDFIKPDSFLNTFFDRCVKLSTRQYVPLAGNLKDYRLSVETLKDYRLSVGTIDVEVHHVERKSSVAPEIATSPSGWTFEPLATSADVADWDHVPTLEGIKAYLVSQISQAQREFYRDVDHFKRHSGLLDALSIVLRRINA